MANGKKKGHVLAVPLPVQGHVRPLMKLCRLISSRGVKVTFVNSEYVHRKILASDHQQNDDDDNMVLTSIPDGLPPDDDRKDGVAMLASLKTTMAANLTDLIERINSSKSSDERISCVVADASVGWIFEVAEKMGIQVVGFLSSSAASFAIMHHSPTLIQQRILDLNGSITGSNTISLSDNIPSWRKNELAWSNPIDLKIQKYLFQWFLSIGKTSNQVKWLLCNTSYELEPSACDLIPNLLPIGPFTETTNDSSSSFHHEDESCISWLNEKPHASVIYISFGSLSVMSQIQLNELAHGLEISGRPFLWVRSDLAYGSRVKYPDGFLERTLVVGKIVEWAPQERVLSHPSVACFVSHCGWNSILEGLSNAVPFLCWPYVIDQFHNQSYVCDKWRNGLRIEAGDYLVRTRDEIKTKIDMLFCDYDSLKTNAVTLKTIVAKSTVDQGGSSSRNFQKFIDYLRARPLPKILSKF